MKKILFILLITNYSLLISYSQWVQTNGPGPIGGYFYAVTLNGSNVFVGSSTGVYRSTDNGITWSASLINRDVKSLTVSGSIIYAGTSGSGIYSSTNNGATMVPNFTDYFNC